MEKIIIEQGGDPYMKVVISNIDVGSTSIKQGKDTIIIHEHNRAALIAALEKMGKGE